MNGIIGSWNEIMGSWGMTVFLASVIFVGLGGLMAYGDHLLTVGQMQSYGIKQGLPFLAHGGMWGDVFILSPLLGVITARYGGVWSSTDIVYAGVVAALVSGFMHLAYIRSSMPEAHVLDHQLTAAGAVHLVYMAGALTLIILFYFYTPLPDPTLMWTATALITVHMAFGTHMFLGWLAPSWYPGRPLRDPATYLTVGGCAAGLVWRTMTNLPH